MSTALVRFFLVQQNRLCDLADSIHVADSKDWDNTQTGHFNIKG
jgi:hypothetical protein